MPADTVLDPAVLFPGQGPYDIDGVFGMPAAALQIVLIFFVPAQDAQIMAQGIVNAGVLPILVPLLIGTIMRFPQGSGTTAMITGSAIIAPMLSTLSINPYLAGMALCLTTMCPSFLNDSYFHVVTNFSGLDINTSLKTWTISTILVPLFGSVLLIILSLFIH